MKNIKAVVFDIGGVLLENPYIGEFWKNKPGSKKLRGEFGTGKISNSEFIEKASNMLKIPKNKFIEEYGKAYFPVRKIKPVFELYKKLKLKKVLFSDTNPLCLEFIKKKYQDIFRLADQIFMSSQIGVRKNQEKSYIYLIKSLKLTPYEILLIDDRKEVLNLAKKQGIITILYKNPNQLKKDIEELGIHIK